MVKRLNLSVSDEQDEWITQHNLSASTLLQTAIDKHKENWTAFNKDRTDEIKEWARKNDSLRIELGKRIDFIEKRGLIKEYEKM